MVIGLPFALAPVNDTVNVPSDGVIEVRVGASGLPFDEAEVDDDAAPEPSELTARIATEYVTPFVRPEIRIGEIASALMGAIQFVPPSTEYSMLVTTPPPFDPSVKSTSR